MPDRLSAMRFTLDRSTCRAAPAGMRGALYIVLAAAAASALLS